jgi:hypothetical protein
MAWMCSGGGQVIVRPGNSGELPGMQVRDRLFKRVGFTSGLFVLLR